MRVKIKDLQRSINHICNSYNITEDSIMELSIREDNPGEGQICEIATMTVSAKDGSSGLIVEVFNAGENRPARSVQTKFLKD